MAAGSAGDSVAIWDTATKGAGMNRAGVLMALGDSSVAVMNTKIISADSAAILFAFDNLDSLYRIKYDFR
jgi:hypothetical protein